MDLLFDAKSLLTPSEFTFPSTGAPSDVKSCTMSVSVASTNFDRMNVYSLQLRTRQVRVPIPFPPQGASAVSVFSITETRAKNFHFKCWSSNSDSWHHASRTRKSNMSKKDPSNVFLINMNSCHIDASMFQLSYIQSLHLRPISSYLTLVSPSPLG